RDRTVTGVQTCALPIFLTDGDVSDDSTPHLPFSAPPQFIYEALIRPFAQDPTPLVHVKLGDDGVLTVDGVTHAITRSTGSFIDRYEERRVGKRIVLVRA